MSLLALILALVAACLHAGWNVLVKGSDDQLVAAWTVVAGAAIMAIPVLSFTGLPDSSVWDLIVISVIVQVVYVLMLTLAYRLGDLSFVYPMARGVSPVLISLVGVAYLGDEISTPGWLGVTTVTAALTLLAWRRADRSGLWAALATGLMIAAYTSVDAAAVRQEGAAIAVIAAEFVLLAIILGVVVLALRGPHAMLGMIRDDWRKAAIGSVASGTAYLLVMIAALIAPVGLVSGVREVSVLIAVIASRLLLHEEVTRLQVWTVAAAAGGILFIALA